MNPARAPKYRLTHKKKRLSPKI